MPIRNKAIPISPREYPEYTYREFPKLLGIISSLGAVVPVGTKQKDDDNWVILTAMTKEHEAQLRAEYPDLPTFTPPPSSLTMAEMRAKLTELEQLREEVKRLRLQQGGIDLQPGHHSATVTLDRPETHEVHQPHMPPETDRGPPGTDPSRLAAGEDPNGDPWAGLPENQTPEPGKPPSIKGNTQVPSNPKNKLGR